MASKMKKTVGYLDSQVNGLNVVGKNCAICVHQEIIRSTKRSLCWEGTSIKRRKRDDLTRRAAPDHSSLTVWALRNRFTGRRPLLGDGQPRREHRSVPTTHELRV